MTKFSNFNRLGLPNALEYYQKHLQKLSTHGEQRMALCPFHDDHNPSLSVNVVDTGAFYCHSCRTAGGDILAFHMKRYQMTFIFSAKALGAWEE